MNYNNYTTEALRAIRNQLVDALEASGADWNRNTPCIRQIDFELDARAVADCLKEIRKRRLANG